MCTMKNARAAELARSLHQKYISLKTGVCSFLPEVLVLLLLIILVLFIIVVLYYLLQSK